MSCTSDEPHKPVPDRKWKNNSWAPSFLLRPAGEQEEKHLGNVRCSLSGRRPPLRTSAGPSEDTDDEHYPHVVGGAEIVSDGMTRISGQAQIGGGGQVTISRAKGTLGCVAINQATTDPSKKAVALTNAHVLLDVALTTTHDNAAVGQPDTSSSCCKSCDNTIGHTDQDVVLIGGAAPPPPDPPTGVDAGFVTLAPETEWSAEVILSGAGGSITTEQIAGPHVVDDTAADGAVLAAVANVAKSAPCSPVCGSSSVACQGATACPTSISNPPPDNLQAGCLYAKTNGFTNAGTQKVTMTGNTTALTGVATKG